MSTNRETKVTEELEETLDENAVDEVVETEKVEDKDTEEIVEQKEVVEEPKQEEKQKSKVGRKKLEETQADNDIVIEEIKDNKVINKTHVVYLKFKKGENCWLCAFIGQKETEGSIFNKLENKYKFRPKYLQIKNVIINEYLQPLYEFDSISGYHTEDKLFDNEKDCQEYCNKL